MEVVGNLGSTVNSNHAEKKIVTPAMMHDLETVALTESQVAELDMCRSPLRVTG